MRVQPSVLLVVLAIALPFIVQIRTLAGFVGYDMTAGQNAAIGALLILAIVLWAVWPDEWVPRTHENGNP